MTVLFLGGLILLNILIAWWNCYATGLVWRDTRAFGGWFEKALIYSAAIQSVAGFSIPILLLLTWVFTSFGDYTPEEVALIWEGVFALNYVAIIIPVVGSGFIIWGHSMRVAWQRRDVASMATAGWNTFAQVSNTVSLFRNLGPAMGKVGDLFKGNNGKNALGLLVIMLVVVALLASVLLTATLINYYSRKYVQEVDRLAAA